MLLGIMQIKRCCLGIALSVLDLNEYRKLYIRLNVLYHHRYRQGMYLDV